MPTPRTLLLFDGSVHPSSWNERMMPGEYAVLYSSFESLSAAPFCTVFSTLAEAETRAADEIGRRPDLRCRIYDHNGFVGAPVRELRGSRYTGDLDLSPRFRRWIGSLLFFGGIILTAIDWAHDFRLSWPALVGTRMILPGLILLFIEAMLLLHARSKTVHAGAGHLH